jgi:hypothetical protein
LILIAGDIFQDFVNAAIENSAEIIYGGGVQWLVFS